METRRFYQLNGLQLARGQLDTIKAKSTLSTLLAAFLEMITLRMALPALVTIRTALGLALMIHTALVDLALVMIHTALDLDRMILALHTALDLVRMRALAPIKCFHSRISQD